MDGFEGLGSVQLATVALVINSIPVEDAEGHVGGLLDFGEEHALADGVYSARRNHKGVTGLHRIEFEIVLQHAILHGIHILLCGNLLIETNIQSRTFIRLNDMPHLRFAVLTVFLLCEFVIWVHLYGKIVSRIDELYEQREVLQRAAFPPECFLALMSSGNPSPYFS